MLDPGKCLGAGPAKGSVGGGRSCCPRAGYAPQTLGSIPEIQELLTLGLCISMVFLEGWQVSGAWDLGSQPLPPPPPLLVLAAQCLALEHGVRGCRLSDAIRIWPISLHATC